MAARGYFQAAWIVDDLQVGIAAWLKAGVGPFYIVPHAQLTEFCYREKLAKLDFSVALAQSGPAQIELIRQHDGTPSHYRDVYAPGESGFHHMCRFTDDFDADVCGVRVLLAWAGSAMQSSKDD